ncbi:MAG: hypothetical protein HPY66_3407 [Firmicutes bacterium]|nr:hypothetical protein [Bacillota bacterium]
MLLPVKYSHAKAGEMTYAFDPGQTQGSINIGNNGNNGEENGTDEENSS